MEKTYFQRKAYIVGTAKGIPKTEILNDWELQPMIYDYDPYLWS